LTVPLTARERILGTITLAFAASDRRHGPTELRIALDFAARSALAVDNARLYQEARDAAQVREDFLSVAGHELKTPLTAAQINLELVARAARRARFDEDGEGEPLTRRVALVERQMSRLGVLVDQLLDVSRLTSGRIALDLEEVELGALGHEVVGRVREEAARARTTLTVAAPEPVVGQWDRARVDQLLSNLLSNAMKYGAGCPVELEIRAQADQSALVVVRDRGVGIAPENQARIFRKFERAVSDRHFGGLGLGLWICREIVEAMRGTIQVESSPGRGATFTVRLPRP
jgi:signal transduction histidine kinase